MHNGSAQRYHDTDNVLWRLLPDASDDNRYLWLGGYAKTLRRYDKATGPFFAARSRTGTPLFLGREALFGSFQPLPGGRFVRDTVRIDGF